MTPWKTLALLTVLMGMTVPPAAADSPEVAGQDARLEAALRSASSHPAERKTLRIEAGGRLAQDLHSLTLYGRGVGFWNQERQFHLGPAEVKRAIGILLHHHLCRLPDNIGGEEEEPEIIKGRLTPPRKGDTDPRYLLRTLTVTMDGLSKTVVQEAELPEARPLEQGLAELAALCRTAAAHGITAGSLKEALALLAKGTLAPEALSLTVNAPQLRSLKDNRGQGWILRIEHGRILAQSHTLRAGYVSLADRPLDPRKAQELAGKLLEAGVTGLPSQVNVPGYLHLNLHVLSHGMQVMARTYAGKPGPDAASAGKTFAAVRSLLRSVWKREAESAKTSSKARP